MKIYIIATLSRGPLEIPETPEPEIAAAIREQARMDAFADIYHRVKPVQSASARLDRMFELARKAG
jgi:hypothetical protein